MRLFVNTKMAVRGGCVNFTVDVTFKNFFILIEASITVFVMSYDGLMSG